mmetsp:Transcript_39435/g.63166  ORF Transcript_39435/g.63166 Transcript_39435/m.63166 type:complete len:697 (+) Transcript_39435:181-2271(+)
MASFFSDDEASQNEESAEREEQLQPRRLKRGSRISRGNRNSRQSNTQNAQGQRRASFFSEDEEEDGQTHRRIQELARNVSQVSSQAEQLSYLSSSEESDEDSIRNLETNAQATALPASAGLPDDKSRRDEAVHSIVMKRRQNNSSKADAETAVASGNNATMVAKSADHDSPAAHETSSDYISTANTSDVHTSVPSGQDLEGSEETSRHGSSSARQETDSGDTSIDQNLDDQVTRTRSLPSMEPLGSQQRSVSLSFKASLSEPLSDRSESPRQKVESPRQKELESLQQKFDEFAKEQCNLSSTLHKALELERRNQDSELKEYMDTVADLTRLLEEERDRREKEARMHEEMLHARFRQHEVRWESEIASLQAEIGQLRQVCSAPMPTPSSKEVKLIIDELELPWTSLVADNTLSSTRIEASQPDTPQSRDNSQSVDTVFGGSPAARAMIHSPAAKTYSGGDETNPLLLSGATDLDTPASYVLHRKEPPAPQRPVPGTVRSASPRPIDKTKENGGPSLNIWLRSLADELREDEMTHTSKGHLLGKTINVSDKIDRALDQIFPDYMKSCGEARTPPCPRLDHTILPPPVRVQAAFETAPLRAAEGARSLTPQRAVLRPEVSSASSAPSIAASVYLNRRGPAEFGAVLPVTPRSVSRPAVVTSTIVPATNLVHSAETASSKLMPSLAGGSAPVSCVAQRLC